MGVIVYDYFVFAGKSSEDFCAHISGTGTFLSPERDVKSVTIPGRNGDLHLDNGRFNNMTIKYPAFITEDFEKNYSTLRAFLLSKKGYEILADSYHPDHYRRARFAGRISPNMTPRNRAGSFDLSFDCDPRLFLKSGDQIQTIENGGSIYNRTLYPSKPLIRAYGTGSLTVADTTVEITQADGYTDLDSELEEAYKDGTNRNGYVILTNGAFPELPPGLSSITLDGITKLEIRPRWWTV